MDRKQSILMNQIEMQNFLIFIVCDGIEINNGMKKKIIAGKKIFYPNILCINTR